MVQNPKYWRAKECARHQYKIQGVIFLCVFRANTLVTKPLIWHSICYLQRPVTNTSQVVHETSNYVGCFPKQAWVLNSVLNSRMDGYSSKQFKFPSGVLSHSFALQYFGFCTTRLSAAKGLLLSMKTMTENEKFVIKQIGLKIPLSIVQTLVFTSGTLLKFSAIMLSN